MGNEHLREGSLTAAYIACNSYMHIKCMLL